MSSVRKQATGARIETNWPHGRLRIVVQEHQRSWLTRIARTDVVSHPLFGCWETPILTATHDPDRRDTCPFKDIRLERAFLAPQAPTAIVTMRDPSSDFDVPRNAGHLPRIVLTRASKRLWSDVPPILKWEGWRRTWETLGSRAEREAGAASGILLILLESASPDELVALSR